MIVFQPAYYCSVTVLTIIIDYFYRAHALDPTNPLINLSVALAYVHYALKRQSENRQYHIVQGFSCLFAYYDMRKTSEILAERQEAEYNVGRTYHMLGLTHLAIPYYERCLAMSEESQMDAANGLLEDFTLETAYALQGIWAANGETGRARAITEKWLVL